MARALGRSAGRAGSKTPAGPAHALGRNGERHSESAEDRADITLARRSDVRAGHRHRGARQRAGPRASRSNGLCRFGLARAPPSAQVHRGVGYRHLRGIRMREGPRGPSGRATAISPGDRRGDLPRPRGDRSRQPGSSEKASPLPRRRNRGRRRDGIRGPRRHDGRLPLQPLHLRDPRQGAARNRAFGRPPAAPCPADLCRARPREAGPFWPRVDSGSSRNSGTGFSTPTRPRSTRAADASPCVSAPPHPRTACKRRPRGKARGAARIRPFRGVAFGRTT